MSQENVELVRRIYREVSASGVMPDEPFDPDCTTDWTDVAPDFGVLRGRAATQEALASYWQTFESFRVDAADVLHADVQHVITVVRDGGRMRDGGAEVWSRFFHAWTFRNGKVVRLSSHSERERAFEAVGLSE